MTAKRAMRMVLIFVFVGFANVHGDAKAQTTTKHPMSFDDLIKLHRIAAPELSPDGKLVAYTISTPDLETNRSVSNIWLIATSGGDPIQLTQSGHDGREAQPFIYTTGRCQYPSPRPYSVCRLRYSSRPARWL